MTLVKAYDLESVGFRFKLKFDHLSLWYLLEALQFYKFYFEALSIFNTTWCGSKCICAEQPKKPFP